MMMWRNVVLASLEAVRPEVVSTLFGNFGQYVPSESDATWDGSENATIRDGMLSAMTISFQTGESVRPGSYIRIGW